MPIDNSDLNDLLKTAIAAGKPPTPWYRRWWGKLIYNLKICGRLIIFIFVCYCIGNFAYEHPVLFMAMVAALG